MKVTLRVDGREMTFFKVENIAIDEETISNETTEEEVTAKVAQRPTEEEWFEVKPQDIDQKLFEKKREDPKQEQTRQLILEAFAEMKKYSVIYGRNFKTMMPKKTWSVKTDRQLKEMASKRGDHIANWVEQAFEWAQRIANGETWESICNDADTANWYRLVVWTDSYARLVGGSVNDSNVVPASNVGDYNFSDGDYLSCLVPLVVLYED